MNYYYDLVLNFDLDHLWHFYEWEKSDFLTYVKKIPLFRIDFETMKDFLLYQVKLDSSFVSEIAHKTIVKNQDESLEYAFLISDAKNSLAVLLNEEGKVIALSSVLISDDNNINEFMYTLKERTLSYECLEKRNLTHELRQKEKLSQMIQIELSTIKKEQNLNKLKYLYYEWFGQDENDFTTMYQEMQSSLQSIDYETLEKISYFIRLSYHQV